MRAVVAVCRATTGRTIRPYHVGEGQHNATTRRKEKGMEIPEMISFVQAVGLPAAFAFALLWIVERRLAVIAEKLERVLTIVEKSAEAMVILAEKQSGKG